MRMRELLMLRNPTHRISQHVKLISATRTMMNDSKDRSPVRAIVRSRGRSIARAIARAIVRSLARSLARSFVALTNTDI